MDKVAGNDVYARLYRHDTLSATQKRQSIAKPKRRHSQSCPLPDPALMTISGSSPQATLDGDPNDPHTLLKGVFQFYCRFGRTGARGPSETTMDNANFAKFCRECPRLVDHNFSAVDIDLTFVKVKAKGERRITYPMFLEALGIIATKKYPKQTLAGAVPMLLDVNISTLGCLDSALGTAKSPGKSVWRRKVSVIHEQPVDADPLKRDDTVGAEQVESVRNNQQLESLPEALPEAPVETTITMPPSAPSVAEKDLTRDFPTNNS
ncbi:Aste57867_24939 [Aphanomyces stellatus]|uniref:Aste57867_24939 protein n=1 Tax=Aphanomyces stellatus TaxID=120398 RepID=A0A485LRT6_9STRA|nr:hypothetical protein As57867_024861 [Aphanomyces stellatus]VFU01570.1 Aste57867_24939 [Aphanomyces stellatus]